MIFCITLAARQTARAATARFDAPRFSPRKAIVAAEGTLIYSEEVCLMKRFAVSKTFVLGTGGGRKGGGGGGG
jgi:hypothetical protein